jgi:hypothetical protein
MSTETNSGILQKIFDFFCSLKLSVVVLCLALVLVFAGTLAQEPLGLYLTQERFFKGFFVDYASMVAVWKKFLQIFGIYLTPANAMEVMTAPRIPVFPGGYTIGLLFVLNLIATQIKTFELSRTKFGLQLVHTGLILLLVGQLATDMLAVESSMHIREGETKNYSEIDTYCELAVVDISRPDKDRVTAIPQDILAAEREIRDPNLPFTIRINKFYKNSEVQSQRRSGAVQPPATQGIGTQLSIRELPHETQMTRRDMSSAVIELVTPEGTLGSWLVSMWIEDPQPVTFGGREFLMSLRPKRLYKNYSLSLVGFTHEKYPGTDIPKDFSSRVELTNAASGEAREVRIYMNNPLRYDGETYYQSSYDRDEKGTILQVVRNPGWLTPYVGCIVISLGLLMQFGAHLFQFLTRKREA